MSREKSKGGRPRFNPTKQVRETVELAVAAGESQAAIARLLSIDEKTLRTRLRDELEHGRARIEARLRHALLRAVEDRGNAAAARLLLESVIGPSAAPKPRAKPKLGKKAQAAADAEKSNPGWGNLLDFDPAKVN